MKSYSDDLRVRVIGAINDGAKVDAVAKQFAVSPSWIYKILDRYNTTGKYSALKSPGAPRKLKKEDMKKLVALIKKYPDATLKELIERGKFKITESGLHRILRRDLNITFKKKTFYPAGQKKREVKRARGVWKAVCSKWDAWRLVFLDESGINKAMTRLYGRGEVGERVRDYIPDCRWEAKSILSSIRLNGQIESFVYDGALTGELFKAWVKEGLCPTLKKGDIVIMDNLSSHKVAGIEEMIKSVGAHVKYLPPYSPDMNPVELMWAKIKTILKEMRGRMEDELMQAIKEALEEVSQEDIAAWFRHCGYSSS